MLCQIFRERELLFEIRTYQEVLTEGFWQVALFRGRSLFPELGKP